MSVLKKVFDFYINSSIHVSLSAYALVKMTGYLFGIDDVNVPAVFVFAGTIAGYNFVKYDALARTQKLEMSSNIRQIVAVSFAALLTAIYFFFLLRPVTKMIALAFLTLIVLYTLPFFPNKKNARNWAGVKIYIVSLCWVGVTLFLPVIDSGMPLSYDIFIVALQRFILVFVLVLIFEIIDLRVDDPNLKTVPQQIGVARTKVVGSLLLFAFILLGFFQVGMNFWTLFIRLAVALTVFLFLLFANEKRTKYYTSFWTESIPVFWFGLILLLAHFFGK